MTPHDYTIIILCAEREHETRAREKEREKREEDGLLLFLWRPLLDRVNDERHGRREGPVVTARR